MTNTTSNTQNQQPFDPSLVTTDHSPEDLRHILRSRGCGGCELGLQPRLKAPVVYRGNPNTGRMIVGEAPGLHEDEQGLPFVGPAGELLDKILASVGWTTEEDWYIGNALKCRPLAPPGSGKENLTPKAPHRKACRPYLEREIEWIKPHVVLLLGASAVKAVIPKEVKGRGMTELAGSIIFSKRYPETAFFVMYHPAYLLHLKRNPNKLKEIKKDTWNHIQLLKEIDQDLPRRK